MRYEMTEGVITAAVAARRKIIVELS